MDVVEVVSSMATFDVAAADFVGVREDLARLARVRSWLDAREIADRRRLEDFRAPFGATPDQEFARASNKSRRDADRSTPAPRRPARCRSSVSRLVRVR